MTGTTHRTLLAELWSVTGGAAAGVREWGRGAHCASTLITNTPPWPMTTSKCLCWCSSCWWSVSDCCVIIINDEVLWPGVEQSVRCVQGHQPPPIIYPTSSSTVLLSQSYPQFSSVPQLSSTTKQLSLNMFVWLWDKQYFWTFLWTQTPMEDVICLKTYIVHI